MIQCIELYNILNDMMYWSFNILYHSIYWMILYIESFNILNQSKYWINRNIESFNISNDPIYWIVQYFDWYLIYCMILYVGWSVILNDAINRII